MTTALATVDITGLVEYLNKGKELAGITKLHAPSYLRDFILGQDLASNLLSAAIELDVKNKGQLDFQESVAYLEKASAFLQLKGIKDTSEARKMYISLDPQVMAAIDQKAKSEALVSLIKNKLIILKQYHDDLKRITYDNYQMTSYENN